MTSTGYTIHPKCTPNNKGITAMNTKVRLGIIAIHCRYKNGKWIIDSPLKLGQRVYIEGMGYFTAEDTGYFANQDEEQDYWTIDIYFDDYQKAKEWGKKLIKVYISWDF